MGKILRGPSTSFVSDKKPTKTAASAVDHHAEFKPLKQGVSGSWPHTAKQTRAFQGAAQPGYASTRHTPKRKRADGAAGEKIHDEMWALNTQLDERWWTSLRDESILYLGYQRNENSALHSGLPPPTERQFSKILLSIIQLKIIIYFYFY